MGPVERFWLILSWVFASFLLQAPVARAEGNSDIVMPALSFFLPGLDQWAEGDYGSAAAYTGVAVGGTLMSQSAIKKIEERQDGDAKSDLNSKDNDLRRAMLGSQLSMASGSFSTYHAFRKASEMRKADGQYEFLTSPDSPRDLLLAPFRFDYLARPSTFLPLGIISGLAVYLANTKLDGIEHTHRLATDYAYGTAFSYLAGTHEEALFRGWLMPVLTEYVSADTTANVAQSVIFAAAHLGSTSLPLPQLLLGWHLGYVTQQNGWSLSEAAFIHTWWDVVAFIGVQYAVREKAKEEGEKASGRVLHAGHGSSGALARNNPRAAAMLSNYPLMLPPISISF
ncbi:MAG: hypothetical protein RIQ81_2587 [Pseudomonadota bacterium]|jgi:hypothetical protein